MLNMHSDSGTTYIEYRIPTRLLIGFQSQFVRATSGLGQAHSLFAGYEPIAPYETPQRQFGSLVADQQGATTAYALVTTQQRGTFFIPPGTEVYEGMVVGEHIRSGDLVLNVAKAKHLTNHRAKPSETSAGLTPHRVMSLDDCIEFLADDELLEVTPDNLRLRKRILSNTARLKDVKRKKDLVAG
jgi:GTP-binding protein